MLFVGTVNLWFDFGFDPFMGSFRKPLVMVSHIKRIFSHYSFASELIRQKVGEDSFDEGYQNQRLSRTSHKWVESEIKPEVNT